MFDFLQRWRRADPLKGPVWQRIQRSLPQIAVLDRASLDNLEARMRFFLGHKTFDGANGMRVTPVMKLTIAALACLPIMNLEDRAYADWKGVIVYPSAFLGREAWRDGAGVVHEEARPLLGMARSDGPVLLSWPAVAASAHGTGHNVVIHECAHKLDMMNGSANGSPPLHAGMSQKAWSHAFLNGYHDLSAKVHSGGHNWIDPYAATNPAEFFAVLSESFFEQPHALAAEYPAIYTQLTQFYRQDPGIRIPAPLPAPTSWV